MGLRSLVSKDPNRPNHAMQRTAGSLGASLSMKFHLNPQRRATPPAVADLILVRSMRRTSIIFAIASVVVPFAWAYLVTTALYREAASKHVYVCGLPALANFILASFACVIMSAVAFLIGLISYRRLPTPPPRHRLIELAVLTLPFLVVGSYAASFFIAP